MIMDRDIKIYKCKNCGYEKEVVFYDLSDWDFRSGDLLEENVAKEKAIKKEVCPRCKKIGFEIKQTQ